MDNPIVLSRVAEYLIDNKMRDDALRLAAISSIAYEIVQPYMYRSATIYASKEYPLRYAEYVVSLTYIIDVDVPVHNFIKNMKNVIIFKLICSEDCWFHLDVIQPIKNTIRYLYIFNWNPFTMRVYNRDTTLPNALVEYIPKCKTLELSMNFMDNSNDDDSLERLEELNNCIIPNLSVLQDKFSALYENESGSFHILPDIIDSASCFQSMKHLHFKHSYIEERQLYRKFPLLESINFEHTLYEPSNNVFGFSPRIREIYIKDMIQPLQLLQSIDCSNLEKITIKVNELYKLSNYIVGLQLPYVDLICYTYTAEQSIYLMEKVILLNIFASVQCHIDRYNEYKRFIDALEKMRLPLSIRLVLLNSTPNIVRNANQRLPCTVMKKL